MFSFSFLQILIFVYKIHIEIMALLEIEWVILGVERADFTYFHRLSCLS